MIVDIATLKKWQYDLNGKLRKVGKSWFQTIKTLKKAIGREMEG